MKLMMRIFLGLVITLVMPVLALAQSSLLHADLPLFDTSDELWPQSFISEDSFGCATRVRLGNWKIVYFSDSDDEDVYSPVSEYLEIYNYGVMHCAYGFKRANSLANLEFSSSKLGHMIELGAIKTKRGERELWAIQEGFRPGSSYTLLASKLSDEAKTEFEILPVICKKKYQRDVGSIDIFMTRYCSINTKIEFNRFAKGMAQLEPIGLLSLIPNLTFEGNSN